MQSLYVRPSHRSHETIPRIVSTRIRAHFFLPRMESVSFCSDDIRQFPGPKFHCSFAQCDILTLGVLFYQWFRGTNFNTRRRTMYVPTDLTPNTFECNRGKSERRSIPTLWALWWHTDPAKVFYISFSFGVLEQPTFMLAVSTQLPSVGFSMVCLYLDWVGTV